MTNQPARDMSDESERMPSSGKPPMQVSQKPKDCSGNTCKVRSSKYTPKTETKVQEPPKQRQSNPDSMYVVPYITEDNGYSALSFRSLEEANEFAKTVKNNNPVIGAVIRVVVSNISNKDGVTSKIKWW